MCRKIEVRVNVSDAVPLPGPLEIAATVHLPEPGHIAAPTVVIFAVPGGGYSRGYFDMHFPGHTGYSEADFHTGRGMIMIACDHLGVGDSTLSHLDTLTPANVADAYALAVRKLCQQISDGTLAPGYAPIKSFAKIGIGQSLGGMMTIISQGRNHVFDGIAPLGYSAIHTQLPQPDKAVQKALADSFNQGPGMNSETTSKVAIRESSANVPDYRYPFHMEDVPKDILEADMAGGYPMRKTAPPFGSTTMPMCSVLGMTPGIVAKEAAAVKTPVLIAMGERDVCPEPHAEPGAYRSSGDVSLFIAPKMAHMHNFATTRQAFWARTSVWAARVARNLVTS